MQEPMQLQKTDVLSEADGCRVWATNEPDLAVMEWESESACRVADRLQELIRKHALATSFVDRLGNHALIVRRLEPLGIRVVPRCSAHDTHLEFLTPGGDPVAKEDVTKLPGVSPSRLEVMVDSATHVARSLRAHLLGSGVTEMCIPLQFGLGSQGECLMQVPNPLACDLGIKDMSALYKQLGGESG